jgi:hypothetical protein
MMIFTRRSRTENSDPAVNPNRNADLFTLTTDGYIIAQDIASQQEYIDLMRCPDCGAPLTSIAHINRAFQGLNEIVVICIDCGAHGSFIFDISNEVYQNWWEARMGEAYVRAYDGQPRVAVRE